VDVHFVWFSPLRAWRALREVHYPGFVQWIESPPIGLGALPWREGRVGIVARRC